LAADLKDQLQSTLSGGYTLGRELTGGGMSRVFTATETSLRREVVVKVLPPERVAGINVERFRREILLAAGLQHAHIVPVLAAGETNGLPWFTMPFVDGESLRQRIGRAPLPISETLSILRDVARALAYAHSRGVVHRDIKPDNVLLSGGSAVVTDFGIAKAMSASREEDATTTNAALTGLGMAMGTPAYMSPEQVAGDPDVDARSDIYSFGCLAYELLAGRPPFFDKTPQRILAAHMTERPRPIAEIRPDAPTLLSQTIMACLEKDARSRPASAQDLVRALDLAMTTSGGNAAAAAVLLSPRVRLSVALGLWLVAFLITWLVAKAAIVVIGLPSWVLPGALIVMGLGLPVILFTAFVHREARVALGEAKTVTPGGSVPPSGTLATIALRASPHVSWGRTVRGGVIAFGTFIVIVAGFMLLRALGIGPAGSLLAAGRLKERDMLLVSDFTVPAADSSLSTVVTEAVRTSLGQSSVLAVVQPAAVAAALRRMQQPTNTRIDKALARDIAVREGAKAVVSGDLTPLAGGYIVTMRLVTADSGVELASFHETADSPKELLPTLDKLSRSLREKAGESLRQVQSGPPLEQVTTPSLEALRLYAEAVRAHDVDVDYRVAIARERAAVALDPGFAMAWRKMSASAANWSLGQAIIDSAIIQAYRHRDRLSERERLLVEARYFGLDAPGHDRPRAVAALQAAVAKYPTDIASLISLGREYEARHELAPAESLFARAITLDSSNMVSATNQMYNAADAGNYAAADRILDAAARHNAPAVASVKWLIDWEKGHLDEAGATAAAQRQQRNDFLRSRAQVMGIYYSLARGRLKEAAGIAAQRVTEDSLRGAQSMAIYDALNAATVDILFRNKARDGAQRLDRILAAQPIHGAPVPSLSLPDPMEPRVAIAYARAGQPARAREVLAQWTKTANGDTAERRWREPFEHMVAGELALAEGKPRAAVDEFRTSARRPDGPVEWCGDCREAQIGAAFDRAGMADSAIVAYEKYVAMTNFLKVVYDATFLPGTLKRLSELYEQKGDAAKAIAYGRRFIELWKDADPELQPQVTEMRSRVARLSKRTG